MHDSEEMRVDLSINKFFRAFVDLRASEMLMQVGCPPAFCLNGEFSQLDMPPIDEHTFGHLCWPLLNRDDLEAFKNTGSASIVHSIPYKGQHWQFLVALISNSDRTECWSWLWQPGIAE